LFLTLLVAAGASAADIHVDGTTGDDARDGLMWSNALRTIGRAVAVARNLPGPDTIHVAAGAYTQNVLLDVSDVTLLGGYPSGGGARNPTANLTVIDGGGLGPALTVSGSGGAVVLSGITVDGFTLTNGRSLVRSGYVFGGGGAFIEEAEVALTNNVVRDNVADGVAGKGGGVYVYRVAARPTVVRGNRIEANTVEDGLGGGAWLVDQGDPATLGPLVFEGNQVIGNRAIAATDVDPTTTSELNGNGGGLVSWGGETVISGNTFGDNVAEALIDTDFTGQGGGLYLIDGFPAVTNNTIVGNIAQAAGGAYGAAGGGAYVLSAGGTWDANTIASNLSRGDTGLRQAWGAGINVTLLQAADPVLTNNAIRDNAASGGGVGSARGGGVYAFVDSTIAASLRIEGGVIERNRTPYAGGGAWLFASDPTTLVVEGTEVRANEADRASGIMAFGDVTVRHARIRENRVFDPDGDQVSEIDDNCPGLPNGAQLDTDGDTVGDDCDDDDDDDLEPDATDNCDLVDNPGQADSNGDGVGDACQGDLDADGWADAIDNCPTAFNPMQEDATADGIGDACQPAAFDPLETNASGMLIAGDAIVTNVEITDNVGQGLEIVGVPGDDASPLVTHATIAGNMAAGFVTYLANGTRWLDSISTDNLLSDGFDTQDVGGQPSSPNVACDNLFLGDRLTTADFPCTGTGNLVPDLRTGLLVRFAAGPRGSYYLAHVAAGQARDSLGIDAGSQPSSASPVAGRTTRTDAASDAGTVDIGYHYETAAPPPPPGELDRAVRVRRAAAGEPEAWLSSPAPTVAQVRWYRGDLAQLWAGAYSHRSPYSGVAGDPECAAAPTAALADPSVRGDGRNWYYLAVPLSGATEGSFGSSSRGVARPRPEESATDLVVNTCP
jgi:hypothetical protein